jgi:hypothetical protein
MESNKAREVGKMMARSFRGALAYEVLIVSRAEVARSKRTQDKTRRDNTKHGEYGEGTGPWYAKRREERREKMWEVRKELKWEVGGEVSWESTAVLYTGMERNRPVITKKDLTVGTCRLCRLRA